MAKKIFRPQNPYGLDERTPSQKERPTARTKDIELKESETDKRERIRKENDDIWSQQDFSDDLPRNWKNDDPRQIEYMKSSKLPLKTKKYLGMK